MALWYFDTPTVREAPFAWNPLMERFSMDRGVTIEETAPNQWITLRYDSYTNELNYTGTGPGAPTVVYPNGLRHYRGGYTHVVSDQDRTDLIASGLVTASNFTLVNGTSMAITSVNGYTGPAVTLTYSDVQAAKQPVVRSANVTTGNVTLPNTSGLWAAIGLELQIPASVGDYVEIIPSFMWQPSGTNYLEMANIVGTTVQRYSSTGTNTSSGGGQGDPAMYAAPSTYRTAGPVFGFTVTAGDLDSGNVRFNILTKGTGGDTLYASTNYPFRWRAINYGPVL